MQFDGYLENNKSCSEAITFQQKHVPGFLQRRLDYFFISNNIQEFILDADKTPAISSDRSPILIFFSKEK